MSLFEFRAPLFFLTGFAWLLLASLLGMAMLFGMVMGTPLPAVFRLIHVHGALVGGVAQLILGAMVSFLPTLLMSGRDRSESHPVLYVSINLGTVGMLVGFGIGYYLVTGIAGIVVVGTFLALLGDAVKQARSSLVTPPLNLWFYGVAVLVLLAGLVVGEIILFRLIESTHIGQARLAHIHLNLLGFVTLTIIGTMHNLFPTILNAPLHSPLLARLTFFLMPAGIVLLIGGFLATSLWTQIAAGGLLIVGVLVYAYNIVRTWLGAGGPSTVATDHLMAATIFLVLTILVGVLVSVNALWDPPKVAFGTLHLMAYTHLALVGFVLQTIVGALSHLLPISLALRRVQSNKRRGPYLAQLTDIVERWRAVQVTTLTLGTLGLAVVATLLWRFPLSSVTVEAFTWVSMGLLLTSLVVFSIKIGVLLGHQPTEEAN